MRQITGGWQISAIYRIASGAPFSVATSGDNGLLGSNAQRPDRIGGGKLDNPTQYEWFDTDDFVQNAVGTFGNAGRNILTAPKVFTFDMGLTRRFKIESKTLEFMAEAFNVLNNFRLGSLGGGPGGGANNITNAFYGQIRSALDPRIMQVALKFTF
jgi:hypothetical protein